MAGVEVSLRAARERERESERERKRGRERKSGRDRKGFHPRFAAVAIASSGWWSRCGGRRGMAGHRRVLAPLLPRARPAAAQVRGAGVLSSAVCSARWLAGGRGGVYLLRGWSASPVVGCGGRVAGGSDARASRWGGSARGTHSCRLPLRLWRRGAREKKIRKGTRGGSGRETTARAGKRASALAGVRFVPLSLFWPLRGVRRGRGL